MDETYYVLLGVEENASADAIKAGYRKEALKWHPDRVTDEQRKTEATKRFQKIAEAYETLSDTDRKREYDATLRGNGDFTRHESSPQDAQDRFDNEFSELLKQSFCEIRAQAGEGNRLAPTLGWGIAGGIAGGIVGSIFFAPAVLPLVVIGVFGGGLRGYANADVATVWTKLSSETKLKILLHLQNLNNNTGRTR